ncbi:cytochrome b N-terminal domain-containing protein [Thermostilla marina]
MSFWQRIRNSQLYRSIIRHPAPKDRRHRIIVVLMNLVLHLHPVSLPKYALRLRFTWCMGGITFFLFLVEILTGVLLMFYYRPTAQYAYADMVALRDVVSFGILRELHRWAAHAMVIAVMLHMLRVVLTGSYKPPREFNWVVGVGLLVMTLLLSFTGYILPWDQLSIWAATVGSNMLGATPIVGHQGPGHTWLTVDGIRLITESSDIRYWVFGSTAVDENTLNRFYVLHCVGIPVVAAFACALHFWRVRKDGGISGPL